MFKSITTVAVYVTDLERAKKFYTDILGFDVSADLGPTLSFLKSKSGKINIYLEAGHKPSNIDNQTTRLSFFLDAEKSAVETYEALKSAGVKLRQDASEPVSDDIYCFQFQDPDGNIIEVAGK